MFRPVVLRWMTLLFTSRAPAFVPPKAMPVPLSLRLLQVRVAMVAPLPLLMRMPVVRLAIWLTVAVKLGELST